jgi:hypothetical protein
MIALPGIARAARPLDTEDTGTAERVEVEIGATYETASDGDSGGLAIQVNVGLRANLEVIGRSGTPPTPGLRAASATRASASSTASSTRPRPGPRCSAA